MDFFIGDYQLEQPVINFVNALDGMAVSWECGLGLKRCSATHPCPLQDKFKVARESLRDVFQNTSIQQLAKELKEGTSFIKGLT